MASPSAAEAGRDKARGSSRSEKSGRATPALSIVAGGKTAEPATQDSQAKNSSAPPKPHRKPKRTLTPGNIRKTVANFIASGPVLARALVKPRTSRALREKVVLGVTSVNDCRYCAWGHTHWALAHGISLDEVNQILSHHAEDLAATNPAEAAAILFAQHYAEHHDQFDPEAIENLRKHYSEAQVEEILAYIRAITLGNLAGNTFDAFLGRFRSHGHTSVFFEGAVAAVTAPIAVVAMVVSKFDRKVGMKKMKQRLR